jgi:ribulose-5-phosphate 4-epimerase/fuculose-1-phosphate aldolase
MIDEGYIKYRCDWLEAPAFPDELVAELNAWRNCLYDAGLVGYYEQHGVGYGNLSIRDGAGFIISGTQTGHIPRTDRTHYARVTDCDIDDNRVSCEGPLHASSEALTHAAIYALDPDIGAVVHVHDNALWQSLMDKVPTTSPEVSFGTPEMAREFARLYQETAFPHERIAVMAGHEDGLVTFGDGIADAARCILEMAAGR